MAIGIALGTGYGFIVAALSGDTMMGVVFGIAAGTAGGWTSYRRW